MIVIRFGISQMITLNICIAFTTKNLFNREYLFYNYIIT